MGRHLDPFFRAKPDIKCLVPLHRSSTVVRPLHFSQVFVYEIVNTFSRGFSLAFILFGFGFVKDGSRRTFFVLILDQWFSKWILGTL